MASLPNNIS
jgi:hypothetical protein